MHPPSRDTLFGNVLLLATRALLTANPCRPIAAYLSHSLLSSGGDYWRQQDNVFPELLERVKTNLKHRREHAEREEHKHRLTVARKRHNIVEKVKQLLLLTLLFCCL